MDFSKLQTLIPLEELEQEAVNQIYDALSYSFLIKMAVMPDCHAGYDLPIGGVALLDGVISPNYVGFDIGCFIGETKVQLADNRSVSFLDMIKENKEGKEHFVFSKDLKGNICIAKAENPRQTKIVDELIQIELDNGEVIKCTTDHIFYDINNNEVKACDIDVGQSLYPLYFDMAKNIEVKKRSYRTKQIKLDEYNVVYNPLTKLYDFIYILSDDYNIRNGIYALDKSKPTRHHLDFNKLNNNPDNIVRMNWKQHFKIHSKFASERAKKGEIGFKKAHELYPEMYSKMSSENLTKLWHDPEFRKRRAVTSGETFRKVNKNSELVKKNWENAGQRGKQTLIDYNKSEKGKAKSKEISNRIYKCEFCDKEIKGYLGFYRHNKCKHDNILNDKKYVCDICSKECKTQWSLEQHRKGHSRNHKVVSIEKIYAPNTPVYCLTVPEFGNFALASGVFVHNCGMTSIITDEDISMLDNKREDVMNEIYNHIPVGMELRDKAIRYKSNYEVSYRPTQDQKKKWFRKKNHGKMLELQGVVNHRLNFQYGTLGSGNHFEEVGYNKDNRLSIVIHSGSRKSGWLIGQYYMHLAKCDDELPQGFLKLDSEIGQAYLKDMNFALEYALENRKKMMEITLNVLGLNTKYIEDRMINENHNHAIVNKDGTVLHRKGATPAEVGQLGVIPGNMRDGTYITEGLGNDLYLKSASHGAGRRMSRTKAKNELSMDGLREAMTGITAKLHDGILDESPMAYKNLDEVIRRQDGIVVKIVDKIKPVINMKG